MSFISLDGLGGWRIALEYYCVYFRWDLTIFLWRYGFSHLLGDRVLRAKQILLAPSFLFFLSFNYKKIGDLRFNNLLLIC